MNKMSKLPHITAFFWIMKICATTLGETVGDLLTIDAPFSGFLVTLAAQMFGKAIGRKLEVGSLTGDLGQLKIDTGATQKTWNVVRDDVLQAGGLKETQKFDRLLNRLDVAQSSDKYGRIALVMLEKVDNLEKEFENRPPDREEAD